MSNVRVVLAGGPSYIPEDERVRSFPSPAKKIKYRYGAHYEHFEHDGEFSTVDGRELPVYRWTARTAIAE